MRKRKRKRPRLNPLLDSSARRTRCYFSTKARELTRSSGLSPIFASLFDWEMPSSASLMYVNILDTASIKFSGGGMQESSICTTQVKPPQQSKEEPRGERGKHVKQPL